VRTWQAVYAMVDPARTANEKTSATTGWAVWSWAPGGKLIVWEMGGAFLKPSEIIDLMFRINETYGPVEIGFEQDGLNEWALQPIREAQSKRGAVPIRPMRAPRGKLDFIKGLQSFFAARTVVFAGAQASFSVATCQFLSFPRGRIDAPNALAFASLLRPGEPVYPDFSPASVFEGQDVIKWQPVWLAMHADGARVAAALCQDARGVVRVLADWAFDGVPADTAAAIVREAARLAGGPVKLVVPPVHFDKFRNIGLVQALQRAGAATPTCGAPPVRGRAEVQALLQRQIRGLPALQVSSAARRTLNGFVGGYARAILPGNHVAAEASEGLYKVLMEGLEAFVGSISFVEDDDTSGNFKYTADGRRYRSALR
jgi:hypothetical protein